MGRKGSGVEVREKSIRLTFTVDGIPHKETLCVEGVPVRPTQSNVRHAHKVANEIRDAIARGTFKLADFFPHTSKEAGPAQTVADALTTFMDAKLGEKSTLNGYRSAANFWTSAIGMKHVKTLRHSDILMALKQRPMMSGKTVANYVSVLRSALDLMVDDTVILKNPVGTIEVPYQPPEVDPFTRDEAEAIIADHYKHYPECVANYIAFKFYTGLRTSESFALKWLNVDLRSGNFLVADAMVAGEDKNRTKTKASRLVLLNSRARAALEAQQAHTLLKPIGYVFLDPEREDAAWTKEHFYTRRYWIPTLKRLKIRYRQPYNTRHTYATMMLMAGMTPAFCAKQLGHDIRVFLKTYSRWLDGAADVVEMQRLERSISPASSLKKPGSELTG